MPIFDDAPADLETFLTAEGRDITFIDPHGVSAVIKAIWRDIHLAVDPDTGQAVSARQASVFTTEQRLRDAGLNGIPTGVSERTSAPWIARVTDTGGAERTYKVSERLPDAGFGAVLLNLEAHQV